MYNFSMAQRIEAIFENGVFRPLGPVELGEHVVVRLVVDAPRAESEGSGNETSGALLSQQRAALGALREEMNALPLSSAADGFSGADHDRLLYGTP